MSACGIAHLNEMDVRIFRNYLDCVCICGASIGHLHKDENDDVWNETCPGCGKETPKTWADELRKNKYLYDGMTLGR
jgi:hypothetical protein